MVRTPASAVNFRDLGGHAITGGGTLRPGLLFRSASPQFMSSSDTALLVAQAPLRLVLDLRYVAESAAEGYGTLADTGVRTLNVPIVGAGGAQVEMDVLAGEIDNLAAHYISYVTLSADAFVTAFRALAEPDGMPALIHCAAGKDRTGVLVAVLLDVLGVADETIIADYARTAEQLPRIVEHLSSAPSYADTIGRRPLDDEFAQSPPATMRRFLDWLAAEHGSASRMLLRAGLEREAIDILRDRLVVRAAA